MKKKLLALIAIGGYTGGCLAGEPASPFGPHPFGAPASFDEHAQPHETALSEVAPVQPGIPADHASPFGAPETVHPLGPVPAVRSPFVAEHPESPVALKSEHSEGAPEQSHGGVSPFEHPVEHSDIHPLVPFHQSGEKKAVVAEMHGHMHPEHQGEHPAQEHQADVSGREWEAAPDAADSTEKESKEDEEIDGKIDTIDREGSGNWLLKRIWWEKTEPVYEEIKQVFNEIMNARMDFISQRNRLDRELDVAYGQIGLEEGELQDILEHCLNLVKQDKKEQGFLTKEEETLYNTLLHKQNDLEQIKLDIKALQAVDQKIDEALEALFKQIDVANQYEQKAWENFKDIARELNDKVARKSYYETEGLLKDVQNVHSYITGEFSNYFNQTLQSARTHSQSITSQVHALKQAGVDLKQQLETLERTQEADRMKKEMGERDKQIEAEANKKADAKIAQEKANGFFGSILYSVKTSCLQAADWVLHGLSSALNWIKGWFVKGESAVAEREKALVLKIEDTEKKIAEQEQKLTQEQTAENEDHKPEGRQYESTGVTHDEVGKSGEEKNPFKISLPAASRPSVMPEAQNPFAAPAAPARPVSVMPHQPKNPVAAFGAPPTEHKEPENPFERAQSGGQLPPPPALAEETKRAISPFVG